MLVSLGFLLTFLANNFLYCFSHVLQFTPVMASEFFRTRMEAGDCTSKETVPCLGRCLTMSHCDSLVTVWKEGNSTHWNVGVNGSWTMVVPPPYPHGASSGFRQVCTEGLSSFFSLCVFRIHTPILSLQSSGLSGTFP